MFKSKVLLTVVFMASLVSLTACGQKATQSTTASSQTKVVKTSSTSSSSLPKTKTTTSTEAGSGQEESSTEISDIEAGSSVTDTSLSDNLEAIVNGDYSSLVGTWSNAKGTVLTITADGKLYYDGDYSENQYHQLGQFSFSHSNHLVGGVTYYNNGNPQGGAAMAIVPAGVENSLGFVSEFDHLEIGQSVNSGHIDEQYFRQ